MMTAASLFIANMKLWRSNISYMSIKETYDLLPDGVCIYDINGNRIGVTNDVASISQISYEGLLIVKHIRNNQVIDTIKIMK